MNVGTGELTHPASCRLRVYPKELSSFLLSRQVENCSPSTVATYDKRVRYLLEHANKPLNQIQKSDIELWFLSLKEKNLSPHTIESYYRTINTFFLWLVSEEYLTQSPMRTIKRPKTPKYAKEFLTEAQFQTLLAVCPGKDYRGIRNRAWLWLLWTTGCRFSELANLQLNDLDWQRERLRVIGKGSKERYVPFEKEAQTAILRYINVRPDGYPNLWIGEERKPMVHGGLRKVTRTIYERAGIKVDDIHHIFRRTRAYTMLMEGVPARFIQLILGWESITMMNQYIKRADSEDALEFMRNRKK